MAWSSSLAKNCKLAAVTRGKVLLHFPKHRSAEDVVKGRRTRVRKPNNPELKVTTMQRGQKVMSILSGAFRINCSGVELSADFAAQNAGVQLIPKIMYDKT
uniref:HDC04192 n=1 Tax=Drosophila melanogaster TaxID=7227 RepID=Q6IGZ3_DROME|nr:TPA_inf: HDC04192 [Drosophila melanogaster]